MKDFLKNSRKIMTENFWWIFVLARKICFGNFWREQNFSRKEFVQKVFDGKNLEKIFFFLEEILFSSS